jgi:hypothetical protein
VYGVLEGASPGHQGRRRDDALAMGLEDPLIDARGNPEVIGVDDQSGEPPFCG